jgi:hypothetical protein
MWRDRNLGTTLIKLPRAVRQHAASRGKLPIAGVPLALAHARHQVYIGDVRGRRGFRAALKAEARRGLAKSSVSRRAVPLDDGGVSFFARF